MNGPVVIAIRPEPGLAQTIDSGREAGLRVVGCAMFEVTPLGWDAPGSERFDGLLLGSANAIRHGGPQIAQYLDLPVYAVGRKTARLARSSGYSIARCGEGGLQELLDGLGDQRLRLLRLGGTDQVALSVNPGMVLTEISVYENRALPAPDQCVKLLEQGGIVLLHSALAAEHFAKECNRLGIDRANVRIAALGPRIADAAGQGWADVQSAAVPSDEALLELAGNMCQL